MNAYRLILFDVDQTLILGAGCGRRALERALQEIFGSPSSLKAVVMNGKTDTQILREALGREPALDEEERVWNHYLGFLREELSASREASVAPGIPALLEALSRNPTVSLGLLTGNIRPGAETKLSHFGLWRYFPTGGFGDDSPDRNQVACVALSRCQAYFGRTFSRSRVLVVGDSVRDIACARTIGARAVAVATGPDPYELLAENRPDLLFRNLGEMGPVLQALSGLDGLAEGAPGETAK